MSTIDRYIEAATRESTRRGYRSAIRHYEEAWGGLLPATADAVARYLAHYAESLALNTLKLRLAALAQWHLDQGFPDPTKAPVVRQVLRGIAELHPARERQARPLELEQLAQVDNWLSGRAKVCVGEGGETERLRLIRDRALILLGFWRAFRSDELSRLRVEHIEVVAGEGMRLHLDRTKTSKGQGSTLKVPSLSRLCPVDAYLDWIALSGLREGPVFRRISRWGRVGETGLHPNSLVPLLRRCLSDAGILAAERYSGHSLRRGFASWANASRWDLKELMEYVGWRDVKSAMRYIDHEDPFARRRIEQGLIGISDGRSGDAD